METQELFTLGQIPVSVGGIELKVKGALVSIRHEDRADILLEANYLDNWKIQQDGSVHQTRVQQPLGSADGAVSSYVSIGDGAGVVSSGGGRTEVSAGGRNVSIINGEVYVDGNKVTGSEESSQNDASNGPDKLEIQVPNSYRGGLSLTYEDGSKIDVDTWQGGDVYFCSSNGDDLKAGNLTALSSFALQSTGSGDFSFEAIETMAFVAIKTGSGDLEIEELNTGALLLTQTGTGDTNIMSGSCTFGNVKSAGTGDVKMRGRFSDISKSSIGPGEIKIRVRD